MTPERKAELRRAAERWRSGERWRCGDVDPTHAAERITECLDCIDTLERRLSAEPASTARERLMAEAILRILNEDADAAAPYRGTVVRVREFAEAALDLFTAAESVGKAES